jgi:hypothetical protein
MGLILIGREPISARFSHCVVGVMTMSIVQLHQREHRSILAGVERRALVWLAMRLPAGVSSDHLTLLGLASMIAAGAAFAAVRVTPWGVVGVIAALAANWLGDRPWVSIGSLPPMRLFDAGGLVAIAGLTVVFVVSAVRNTLALRRAEPLPAADQQVA